MKKILIASTLLTTIILYPVTTFASTDVSITENQVNKITSIDEFLNNDFYNELPKDPETVSFFKEIEDFKKQNPNLTEQEIVDHFDKMEKEKGIQLFAFYEESKATWDTLTNAEKRLIASDPTYALITTTARDLAYKYTRNNYGISGQGDTSDSFRHAVWNALMCKYTSKAWAEKMATAHEDRPASYQTQVFADGFTGGQHTAMDLHNNQKGRDCWSLKDTVSVPSDGELQNRVIAKIKAGELKVLHK